ncbi:MAG: thioredoxin family protein, partial [Bacteroidetes bacterium]|nr:thioredoxin family protein [Bacteroidota bacterium]
QMKPYLDEIAKEMLEEVVVVRINADNNQRLTGELGINELPVLQLYKNNKLSWTNAGYIDKAGIVQKIKINL